MSLQIKLGENCQNKGKDVNMISECYNRSKAERGYRIYENTKQWKQLYQYQGRN